MFKKIKRVLSKSKVSNAFYGNSIQNNANEIHQHYLDPRILISQLISSGEFEMAAKVLKDVTKTFENSHPMSPDYYYDVMKLGNNFYLESKPINKVVAQDKPLSYKGKLTIIDESYESGVDINKFIFQQSLKNKPIKVRIDSLEELIGDTIIDNPLSIFKVAKEDLIVSIISAEEKRTIKAKMLVNQRKKNEVINVIEHLELQITDYNITDETIILSNENQQNSYLILKIRIPLKNANVNNGMIEIRGLNYNVKVRENYKNTVVGEIVFLDFLKNVNFSDSIEIWDIEQNSLVFQGENKQRVENTMIEKIYSKHMGNLRVLKALETNYNVKFVLTEQIDKDQEKFLEMLVLAWDRKEIEYPINEFNVSVDNRESILNLIENSEKEVSNKLLFIANQSIKGNLFGIGIELLSEEKYYDLVFKDISRLKSKLELFEDGEVMKLELLPSEDSTCKKKYKILNVYKLE